MSAAASAATVYWNVDGVPALDIVEVAPGAEIKLDLVIDVDPGEVWDFGLIGILPTGDADITPGVMGPLPIPPFELQVYDQGYVNLGSTSTVIDVVTVVDMGTVILPALPESALVNLDYDTVNGAIMDSAVGPLPVQWIPLVIHITPEPATLGLLVLGGLAALRRRFA
jgi:hypothetical protein